MIDAVLIEVNVDSNYFKVRFTTASATLMFHQSAKITNKNLSVISGRVYVVGLVGLECVVLIISAKTMINAITY